MWQTISIKTTRLIYVIIVSQLEQPELLMENMSAIILNIPNNENDFCNGNNLVCTCQQCEEDRQYEGGESEISDESGEDEWLEDN